MWHIGKRKPNGKIPIIKDENGEEVSEHDTRGQAAAALRALYANMPEGDGEKKSGRRNSSADAELLRQARAIINELLGDTDDSNEQPEAEEKPEGLPDQIAEVGAKKSVTPGMSLNARSSEINRMFCDKFARPAPSPDGSEAVHGDFWVVDTFDGYLIANKGGEYYKVTYRIDDSGKAEFDAESNWQKVQERREWVEAKSAWFKVEQAEEKPLNLSYIKSLGLAIPDDKIAVKSTGQDTIGGYVMLWGNPSLTDVEAEYFTKSTDMWDATLGKSPRPLTWDHNQDGDLKASPVIGQIVDFGDDEVGRWYEAKLERSHRYRKAIDALIEKGKIGTSSDSAPQYVQRVKTGKSTWLKTWPFFAAALTDTPAEPRMIGSLEFLKSIGVTLPDAPVDLARDAERRRMQLLKLAYLNEE